MKRKNIKLAIIFHRFGPYHYARLKDLSEHCDLIAIECSESDNTYSWEKVADKGDFHWETLLSDDRDIDELDNKSIYSLISKCLADFKPNVIAIPGWSAKYSLAAMRWGIKNKIPLIMMSDSTEYDSKRAVVKEWSKKVLLKNVGAAIVAGQDHKDYLHKLGVSNDIISVGYDVVDNNYFREMVSFSRMNSVILREKYNLPSKYILTSNRFIPKKNISRLIDAYVKYFNQLKGNAWPLIILGDGELKEELKVKIKIMNMENNIHFAGFRQYQEIPIYYGLATVFVHASVAEQWGLVVNEAMASGLPVLVSNRCGCTRDLVQDNVNGYTFDPFNIEQISNLLIKITDKNDNEINEMGLNSESIIAEWDLNKFSSSMLVAADKALQKKIKINLPASIFLRLMSRIL